MIVDRKIAFVGGIDLAFGRWDTNKHTCVDPGNVSLCTGCMHAALNRAKKLAIATTLHLEVDKV